MKYITQSNGDILFKTDVGILNSTQRNNQFVYKHPKTGIELIDSITMCNVTSYCEAAEINKFRFPTGRFKQPEDNFAEFLVTNKQVLDYYKKKMPSMYAAFDRGDKGCYPPNEVHDVLCYGFNRWLEVPEDKPVVTFYENAPLTTIYSSIMEGRAVVMSGTFPYTFTSGNKGVLNHINVLVGLYYKKSYLDSKNIKTDSRTFEIDIIKATPSLFIFDDPFGSMHKNFVAGTGNDVQVSYDDFIKYYKPLKDTSKKYAHIFKKSAAVI
jgi:hypothetical protein